MLRIIEDPHDTMCYIEIDGVKISKPHETPESVVYSLNRGFPVVLDEVISGKKVPNIHKHLMFLDQETEEGYPVMAARNTIR